MSSANVDLVKGLYAALAAHDLTAFWAALAPDVVITQSSAIPWGGTYHGHDGARAFFARLAESVIPEPAISQFVDAGERVIAVGRTQGTVRANGARYDVPIVHVWQIEQGRISGILFLSLIHI